MPRNLFAGVCFAVLALSAVALWAAESPAPAPAKPAFTIVTRECGVSEIVAQNYKAFPKWWLSGIHFVDLNGDGALDFYMSSHGRFDPERGMSAALASINDGHGHFTAAKGDYPLTEILLPYDLNEDGKVDLAMNYLDGGAEWWMNHSKADALSFESSGIKRGVNTGRVCVLVDINRDGRLDWTRSQRDVIAIDLGDGKGGFTENSVRIPMTTGYKFEHTVIPADIDGDGRIELLVEWGRYDFEAGKCRVLRFNANLESTDVTTACGLYEDGLSIKGVGDFDQDGDIDIIALEHMKEFSIFLNDGKGHFTKKENAIAGIEGKPRYASWGMAATTDFDNDGIPDILVNGKHFLKLLRGTGSGSFEYMNKAWGIEDYSSAAVDDGLCFGDIDGDGDLDIAGYTVKDNPTPDDTRLPVIYRNDLPARNWTNVRPVGLPGNAGAAGAKIRLYEPGTKHLLWYEEVAIFNHQSSQSYYGLAKTERHFGLGDRKAVDVAVEFYPSGMVVTAPGAAANSTIEVRETAREKVTESTEAR